MAEPVRTASVIPCSTSMRPYPARTSTAERASGAVGSAPSGRPSVGASALAAAGAAWATVGEEGGADSVAPPR